jgi:hypothetical protein
MEAEAHPDSGLAKRTLPGPLHGALVHVFAQGVSGGMLVGGTALAGYYAGHRRSDDLDLFTRDAHAQRAMMLAVGSLRDLGAVVDTHQSSAQFFAAACCLEGHRFTVQVVLDSNLFRVGRGERAEDGAFVATLGTILRMKAATLVSRCSEKNLYDLRWLFHRFPDLEVGALLELGAEIDGGVNPEAVLIALAGARLRVEACEFSKTESAKSVHAAVVALRDDLARAVEQCARKQPLPPIGRLVRSLR